ncbi:DedA family protein [Nocardiopsis sp. CNR-923]|uniref:DedA family protein n=1 Tax=Nocardiopsis sp. CNR-923 TaxID=1904965 RepID=UPI0009F83406|nr:VTT domain-containing protein [Nocardiopsis sp. CNR-923]
MPEFGFLEGQPFWIVYFTLLGVILLRVQATYWIGRGLGEGVSRSRMGRRLGPRLETARERIDRFGAPVVTLSFLTVGVQTAVNLAAGAMRMRFGRYLVAMFLGSLIWAALWSVVFSGVVGAWWALFLDSPWAAVGVTALAVAVVVGMVWRSRRRERSGPRGRRSLPRPPRAVRPRQPSTDRREPVARGRDRHLGSDTGQLRPPDGVA